jgi:hypothetical protein
MASGIEYTHVIAWENLGLQYTLGRAWATYAQEEDIVCLVQGVEELRTKYNSLPGMGGKKELWWNSRLFGPTRITEDGGKLTLALYAQSKKERCPVIHGFNLMQEGPTVGKWAQDAGYTRLGWWSKFVQETGIDLEAKFSETWPELALLSSTWVRGNWDPNQVSPKVSGGLKVWKYTSLFEKVECDPEETKAVLARCTAWADK